MKTFLVSAMVLTLTSCALFQKSSTVEAKLADVRNLSYAAASIGTREALRQNPAWRPQFVEVYDKLNKLVLSGVVTGAFLRDLVASLPVKELHSEAATIAVEAATVLFDQSVGTKINIEQQPYVNAAALGIRDGLKIGLGL